MVSLSRVLPYSFSYSGHPVQGYLSFNFRQDIQGNPLIGAAVIDDILSLLALSLTEQVARGLIDWGPILILLLKAVAFIAIGGLLGLRAFKPVLEYIDSSEIAQRYPEFVFILAMLIAFAYALLAELVGLNAIIGAFLAGVTLKGVSLKNSRHFREGVDYLRVIFSSIFFFSLGYWLIFGRSLWILHFLFFYSLVPPLLPS